MANKAPMSRLAQLELAQSLCRARAFDLKAVPNIEELDGEFRFDGHMILNMDFRELCERCETILKRRKNVRIPERRGVRVRASPTI